MANSRPSSVHLCPHRSFAPHLGVCMADPAAGVLEQKRCHSGNMRVPAGSGRWALNLHQLLGAYLGNPCLGFCLSLKALPITPLVSQAADGLWCWLKLILTAQEPFHKAVTQKGTRICASTPNTLPAGTTKWPSPSPAHHQCENPARAPHPEWTCQHIVSPASVAAGPGARQALVHTAESP